MPRLPKPLPSDTTLNCTQCKEIKPDRLFNRNKSSVYRRGREHICKDCVAIMHKKYTTSERPKRRRIAPGYLSCNKCNRDFPEDQFYHNPNNSDVSSYCRDCEALQKAKHHYKWFANPEYMEKRVERSKARWIVRKAAHKKEREELVKAVLSQIKYFRDAGYEYKQLGEIVGVFPDSISGWCKGEHSPRKSSLEKTLLGLINLKKDLQNNGQSLQEAGRCIKRSAPKSGEFRASE